MYSDLEKESIFLTKRARRCLGQNGTCRACPLPEDVVEAFNMSSKTSIFADSRVLFSRQHRAVSFPEVDKAETLFKRFRDCFPQLLTGCLATPSCNAGDNLFGGGTERNPDPAFLILVLHE